MSRSIEAIVAYGTTLVETFLYLIIILSLYGQRLSGIKKNIISVLSVNVLMAFNVIVVKQVFLSFLIGNILYLLLVWFLLKVKFLHVIYLHAVAIVLSIPIQLMAVIALNPLGQSLSGWQYDMAGILISLVLTLLVIRYVPLNSLMNYFMNKNKMFIIIIVEVFVIVSGLILVWNNGYTELFDNTGAVVVIATLLMTVNFIMVTNGLKNQHIEEKVTIYDQYLSIIDELIEEIKGKQHDHDSHITALHFMLEIHGNSKETIGKVTEYLNSWEGDASINDLIKLENKILAAFLYSKKRQAIQKDINLEIEINYHGFETNLADYQVVDVLSVLIDNAFEATKGNVKVFIGIKRDKSTIEVATQHPYLKTETLNRMFEQGYSTKAKDGRGIGLYKLQKIIRQCKAHIHVNNKMLDSNYVVFTIIFET